MRVGVSAEPRGYPETPRTASELIHAVVARHQSSSARTVEHDDRSYLVTTRGTQDAGFLVPHSNNGANSPVVVDNRGAVEWIPAPLTLPVTTSRYDHPSCTKVLGTAGHKRGMDATSKR
jgi:hypothetical protein